MILSLGGKLCTISVISGLCMRSAPKFLRSHPFGKGPLLEGKHYLLKRKHHLLKENTLSMCINHPFLLFRQNFSRGGGGLKLLRDKLPLWPPEHRTFQAFPAHNYLQFEPLYNTILLA